MEETLKFRDQISVNAMTAVRFPTAADIQNADICIYVCIYVSECNRIETVIILNQMWGLVG